MLQLVSRRNPKAAAAFGHPKNGTRPPLLPSDPENGAAHRRLKSHLSLPIVFFLHLLQFEVVSVASGGQNHRGESDADLADAEAVAVGREEESHTARKAKRAQSPTVRKASTPVRPDQSENSRPMEQYRWPARLRPDTCMTKSLDCTVERKKVNGSGSNVVRALQNSLENNYYNGTFCNFSNFLG